MSMSGLVKLTWKKSVTDNVTRQKLVINNGGAISEAILTPDVEYFSVVVAASGTLHAELTPIKDFVEGSVTALDYVCPDLTPPEPVTEFAAELVGVQEDA